MWSIIVNFVAQVLFLIHWGSYSNNGIGLGALREAGFYLMALAEVRYEGAEGAAARWVWGGCHQRDGG